MSFEELVKMQVCLKRTVATSNKNDIVDFNLQQRSSTSFCFESKVFMKKFVLGNFGYIILFSQWCGHCHFENCHNTFISVITENQNYMEADTAEFNARNQVGIIGYWPALKMFTVNFSKTGTVDAQVTGIIVGKLKDEFKKEGQPVIFDGRLYRNADTPAAMMGGQQVYWLQLSKINLK